ncbi:hypothetical protein BCIN_06g04620 [Botrytis cinerea B05.10]|uniref:F-box domain-containing protein n=1 Tax=Botryotinia fuckeliana (strain B05.10) TaxID=332648 RepID=A0A384JK84_BOTFB|nr:hypothetical protein BCIN_06g04620 [Botrytis cinerea B05.10]ATZ51009.1 hypothetical protein BCIN_06g04620 [Botrytis cinerea B05.10]
MKGIVGKKKSNDRDEIRQISESKNNEMFRPHRREASLHLIDLPLDIINLIADNIPPSSIVLLGLTCHVFYSLFSKQISETALNAPIWSLPIDSEQSKATSVNKIKLQLHHVLQHWSGLSGYKYFNTADLYRLQNPAPVAEKTNSTDNNVFSLIRAAMNILTALDDTIRYLKEVEFGALTDRQWKIRNSTKLAGGFFFKCPQPDGNNTYLWNNLPEDERLEIRELMQSWSPSVESLKHEFNLHRRLRWSQDMMSKYAEWRELIGF